MSLFDIAVQYILDKEDGQKNPDGTRPGKITEYANDPGGLTKWGISLRSYQHLGPDGIRRLTEQDAIVIYRRDFWDFLHCDQLPPGVAFVVFDCAVNQGQPTAAKLLQQCIGVLTDGIIGPATIEAAVTKANISKLTTERVMRYIQTKNFIIDGRGWIARALETFGLASRL